MKKVKQRHTVHLKGAYVVFRNKAAADKFQKKIEKNAPWAI